MASRVGWAALGFIVAIIALASGGYVFIRAGGMPMAGGVLPNPLPTTVTQSATIFPPAATLRDSERALILRTLEAVRWVIGGPKGAATRLGMKRPTLIHRMKKLGISRPSPESGDNLLGPAPHEPDSRPQLT